MNKDIGWKNVTVILSKFIYLPQCLAKYFMQTFLSIVPDMFKHIQA